MIIAITGGIATGKSLVTRLLAEELGATACSCDAVVHDLYGSGRMAAAVADRFPDAVDEEGGIDRRKLGQRVFADEEARDWLETLIHPLVLEKVEDWLETQASSAYQVVEVPLLYEVDFPIKRDVDVVVACSGRKQFERLQARDNLHPNHNRERIAAQLPLADKVARAGLIVWNEGSYAALDRLIRLAATRIRQHTQ